MLHQSRLGRLPLATPARQDPILCSVGDTLCEVRVWTEEEWVLIPPSQRPSLASHFPGLGWVGAVAGRRA